MKPKNTSTRIILVRHGVTDWLEEGRIHGISDRPLNPFGLEQAELTGKALENCKATRMFVSPLLRAKQTAAPIEKTIGLKSEYLDGLIEKDLGRKEGKRRVFRLDKYKLIQKLIPFLAVINHMFSARKDKLFNQRVEEAWEYIRSQANEGDIFIVVSHSGVLRSILTKEFGELNANSLNFFLTTCSISEIDIYPNKASKIISINAIDHLDGKIHH